VNFFKRRLSLQQMHGRVALLERAHRPAGRTGGLWRAQARGPAGVRGKLEGHMQWKSEQREALEVLPNGCQKGPVALGSASV
jgi:hypothetical protein